MAEIQVGDRVLVDDPGLAMLRRIMRDAGEDPKPNHHGTVDDIQPAEPGYNEEPMVYIVFDGDDGPATSNCAPYPLSEVHPLAPSDDPWNPAPSEITSARSEQSDETATSAGAEA